MTVQLLNDSVIELQGECPSEEAEALLQHLLGHPAALVDWEHCDSAHTAIIQILLLARPTLRGTPRGEALREWVYPLLMPRSA